MKKEKQLISSSGKLKIVKTVHSVIWAFLASCVVAIPFFAWHGEYSIASWLIGIVFIEVAIIAIFGGHCPLTGIAARYTIDRRDNFDIYLPEWLARNNKLIFGSLYVIGVMITVVLWFVQSRLSQ
ncbi:MAG: hypothetical protein KKA41_07365 [Proteobacteria bacterium]|nr:hypothetical protein [Pseudomonadota bacterium]